MTTEPGRFIKVKDETPRSLDVQVNLDHELEFRFDTDGHVTQITCSCGANGKVQML